MTVAIPSAIKVFNWMATMYKANITLKTPMLYAIAFILLFTIGGLTGLFLGALSVDVHLHDTYFVVAHFHYVMMGSALISFLGALHFWWPKMFGRMFHERTGQVLAIFIFIGFNLTFLPQFVLGTRGMARRYFDYDPEFTGLHQLSSIGAFFMGLSLFAVFVNLGISLFRGKKAPVNPWGGSTLEWQAPTPPPLYNFYEGQPPKLYPLYEYDDLVFVSDEAGWVRKDADAERAPGLATPRGHGPAEADDEGQP
jgi:cytochrome c oxidase subunit 1